MQRFFLIGLFSMFITLSAAEADDGKTKLVQRLQTISNAVNQGKVDSLSSFYTEDAEFTNPVTGNVIKGKDEVVKFLQPRVKEIKDRHLTFTFKPNSIDLSEPDFAVVQGVVEITDKDALLQRNARTVELVKEDGQWYIDSVSDIEVPPPNSFYSHLKELEWLIGSWVDKDEDVTITYKARWDRFKNFIFQDFKMAVYNLSDVEGLQIIGWDPSENKLRSWIYDSDGGFGTGLWSKKDKGWQVTLTFTLSDGKKGTATNIYSDITNKNYSFSSIDRKLNGEALPDIEPVTVVREE